MLSKNSKFLIIVVEILMAVVVVFTIYGAIKGAYIGLIVTALALGAMYRQFRVLKSLKADNANDEEEGENDEE